MNDREAQGDGAETSGSIMRQVYHEQITAPMQPIQYQSSTAKISYDQKE
jgi:hypothetical protein